MEISEWEWKEKGKLFLNNKDWKVTKCGERKRCPDSWSSKDPAKPGTVKTVIFWKASSEKQGMKYRVAS